jgi:hypothetical protein
VKRGPRDLGDPVGGGRLDQLDAAAGQQFLTDAVLAALDAGDMLRQPLGQRVGVGHAAFPDARVRADLCAVALGRAAREVKGRELAGRDADLASEMRDGVIRQLVQRAREASSPQQELNRTANARRLAPDLLRSRSSSSPISVK